MGLRINDANKRLQKFETLETFAHVMNNISEATVSESAIML